MSLRESDLYSEPSSTMIADWATHSLNTNVPKYSFEEMAAFKARILILTRKGE